MNIRTLILTPLLATLVLVMARTPARAAEPHRLLALGQPEQVRILEADELDWASHKVRRLKGELRKLARESDGRYPERRSRLALRIERLSLQVERLRNTDEPGDQALKETTLSLRRVEAGMEELHRLIDPDEVPLGAPLYQAL